MKDRTYVMCVFAEGASGGQLSGRTQKPPIILHSNHELDEQALKAIARNVVRQKNYRLPTVVYKEKIVYSWTWDR